MIPVYVYYSSWIPGPKDTCLPLFKQEEGTPFNVTYAYVSWPVCVGPATECLKLSTQAWLFTNSLNSNYTKVPEKAMAPHCSTLAWKIPWMDKPGRLQFMGSRRVVHD